MRDLDNLWRLILAKKSALLCLTKNENNEIEIAGFNITGPVEKESSDMWGKLFKSEGIKIIGDAFKFVEDRADTYKAVGSDTYLTALGLYVVPKYRGDGLAAEILKSRKGLCENLGIKGTATVFTSILSQKAAYRAGFIELASVTYDEMEKEPPRLRFPGVSETTKDLKYMYIKY